MMLPEIMGQTFGGSPYNFRQVPTTPESSVAPFIVTPAGVMAADQQAKLQLNPEFMFYDIMYKRKINRRAVKPQSSS